jgi:hypothetical protein
VIAAGPEDFLRGERTKFTNDSEEQMKGKDVGSKSTNNDDDDEAKLQIGSQPLSQEI